MAKNSTKKQNPKPMGSNRQNASVSVPTQDKMQSLNTNVQDAQLNKTQHHLTQNLTRQYTEISTGFLPPPEMLKKYQELIPDAPERFLQLVENEQKKRHEIDEKYLSLAQEQMLLNHKTQKRGDIIALCFAITMTAVGVLALFWEQPTVACVCLGAPLVTALGHFLQSRIMNKKEQNSERKDDQ